MLDNRVDVVQRALEETLTGLRPATVLRRPDEPIREGSGLTAAAAVTLFTDMVRSRELDVEARAAKARGTGFYTISSAGHEHNAVVGALTRTTDPAFLHYRSGAFMMARARQDPAVDPLLDTMLSVVASADDPIAGGRHKVWGSRPLWVPPQTSTIASHVPKATGTAFSLPRARHVGACPDVPDDAIVVCSFGDASVNHATALAGINAARYAHRRGSPMAILFVCEDNGLGISVPTPNRWVADTFSRLSHLHYARAAGVIDEVWDAVADAVARCRSARAPTFLHLPTVRLWGHAGSDVEAAYRTKQDILDDEGRDPLVGAARRLVVTGASTPQALGEIMQRTRSQVRRAAAEAERRPRLADRAAVVAPLAPFDEVAARADITAGAAGGVGGATGPDASAAATGRAAPSRRTLAAHLNAALHDEFARRPELLAFGEDVGRKGGVYHVTAHLQEAFGPSRVFDTVLDETTILGVAQGAGLLGLLPVPEIQYLAYVHNALDQLRGEACSLSFFSAGQFRNPMVVRIAGLAYQKGFGGHFHNDNAVGALRDIPGLTVAVPARPADGALLLRGALAMAAACGRVVVLLEPIALYHEKDLHIEGDGGWLDEYPPPGSGLLPGEVGLYDDDDPTSSEVTPSGRPEPDALVVTYANGVRMALRAARRLRQSDDMRVRVLDLRWLSPLPFAAVRRHASACGRVVVADECRATGGGIADAIVADLAESGFGGPVASVRAADSYVPLGPAAAHVLMDENQIAAAVREVVRR